MVLANEPEGLPAPLHRMLVNVDRASQRMARMVADLLELSRYQAGRLQPRRERCDLRALAVHVAHAVEPLARTRQQRLVTDLPASPLPFVGDSARLERALLNLLDNAHRHGRDGGTIRLSLARREGGIEFAVADDGPGIPEADLERIFSRFYRRRTATAHGPAGGGLGLAIARALVEVQGGRVWAESAPGAGATFRLALPDDGALAAREGDGP